LPQGNAVSGEIGNESRAGLDKPIPAAAPARRRRRTRYLLWLVEALGGTVAAILLAGALILWRLEIGPIEVNWLTPAFVSYLNARADPISVTIDRTALSWTAGRSTIDLVGSDIHVEDAAGIQIVTVPKLSMSVSLAALLRGHFAATRVAVIGPSLHLVRAETGELSIDLGAGMPAAVPETELVEPPSSWKAMLTGFAAKPVPGDPIGYLDQVSILGADFQVDDRAIGVSWRLSNGELDLTRLPDGLEADLSAAIGLGPTTTRAYGHFRYASGPRQLVFSTSCDGIEPAKLAEILPSPLEALKTVALPLSIGFGGTLDLSGGQIGPLQMRLEAGAGEIVDSHLGGGRLAVTSAKLEAEFVPAEGRLKLADFSVDLGGPTVELTGSVLNLPTDLMAGGTVDKPLAVTGAVTVHGMPIDRLSGIWPTGLSDHTREWIATNLSVGAIDDVHADAALTVTPGADKPVQLDSLTGGMAVRNATVQYLRGLPRVEAVDARVAFTPDRMDFTLSSGRLKGITIANGTLAIDQFGAAFERMTIDLALQGPARDVMTVLDTKPLGYAKAMHIDATTVEGAVDGTLHFQFPLKNALSFAEIDYGAKAQLTDLAVGGVALGHDLTAGAMALTLDPLHLTLQGNAKVGGVPAELIVKQRLSGTAPPLSEVRAKATLDAAARQRFGADPLPDFVHGPIGTDLVYSDLDGHRSRAVLALDLGAAVLKFDQLGWQKLAGPAAHADLAIDTVDGKLTHIGDLALRAPGLDLRGTLDFADGKLTQASLPHLKIGDTDAAVTVTHRGEPWNVSILGPVVDLTVPLKRLDQKDAAPETDKGPTIELDLQSDRVVLDAHRDLKNVKLTGEIADHALAAGSMAATLGGSGKFSFRLDRVAEGGRFAMATDDFGALLKVAGITDSVVGGGLTVTGDSQAVPGGRRFNGHAEGHDYRFAGAPFMVRLLSIASFDAMATLFRGDGIPFTTLKGDFSLENEQLALSHARAYGGAIGVNVDGSIDLTANTLALEGTLVPAYTLNNVLGNVPVLGDMLQGGEGQGLFAANFRMGGSLDDPKISVNPLSTLAPGFLRRLFLFDAPTPSTPEPAAKAD
jgi:hypothetical protein